MHVPKPRKSSAEAAPSTVRKKARVMEEVRDRVSGGDPGVLLREELRRVPRDELRSMLHQLKFDQVVIPSGHQLEAKVKIGLNYNQLGKLRSWLKMYKISMESERLTRRAARERLTAYDMHAETLPFCVKGAKKDGSDPTKVQLLPCAYISPVGAAIFDYLEKCQESECLTWHGGKIPQDEIWVKVGGDHGGGSFKLTFQLLNRDHPNSRQNTVVFSIFEAKDSRENLMLAIGRYAQELGDLQGSKWRAKDGKEHTMRVFGTGDYAFLCLWYGLSGASAVHPCLWCDITKMEMNNPESEDRRLSIPPRTLATLQQHYRDFMEQANGKLSLAKKHHNVIAPVMFALPVDQVIIPGLHISLGLYLRAFKLMETDMHELDLKLQSYLCGVLHEGEVSKEALLADVHLGKFRCYVQAIEQARGLDDEADRVEEELHDQENELAWLACCNGTTEKLDEAVFAEACSMVEELVRQKDSLRSKAEEMRLKASIKKGDGPLTSQLDDLLQTLRVKRQAFHSNSFNGNHVNRMLQDDAIDELTGMVERTVTKIMDKFPDLPLSLVPRATSTAGTYKELFSRFARCHKLYSHGGPMEETAVCELDKAIKDFMSFYRSNVPNGTVPIKMHMLEDHVVPCIRRWGFGLGFMAEQGVEHVHALFNSLARPTCTIPDPVARLKSTLTSHLIGVCPTNTIG
ncbi:uncharacterized protein LOC144875275 [Branchiostoma floridae x Branchiostoma japonicum]